MTLRPMASYAPLALRRLATSTVGEVVLSTAMQVVAFASRRQPLNYPSCWLQPTVPRHSTPIKTNAKQKLSRLPPPAAFPLAPTHSRSHWSLLVAVGCATGGQLNRIIPGADLSDQGDRLLDVQSARNSRKISAPLRQRRRHLLRHAWSPPPPPAPSSCSLSPSPSSSM
jgi:hypothetical protein